MNQTNQQTAKPAKRAGRKPGHHDGRPSKIGPTEKAQVIAIVKVGGSLRDAADVIGVDYKNLYNARQNDESFAIGVRRAMKQGKLRLLKKMGRAKSWRAAAWMLERKYGNEYGRRDRVSTDGVVQVTGSDGGPIQTENIHSFNYDLYRNLYLQRGSTPADGRGVAAKNSN